MSVSTVRSLIYAIQSIFSQRLHCLLKKSTVSSEESFAKMPTAGSLLLTLLATFVSHGLASNGLANPVPRATLRGRREAAPAPTAAPLIKRNWEELIVTGGHTCAWFQGYESKLSKLSAFGADILFVVG